MLASQMTALPMNPHGSRNLGRWQCQPGDFSAWSRSALAVLGATMVLAVAPAAQARGDHDPSSTNLGMLHWACPDALHLRTAVWRVQRDGFLAPVESLQAVDPASSQARLQQMMRLRDTQVRLDALRVALDGTAAGGTLPPSAVVLIGPMLWARFERADGAFVMASHVAGPAPGDVVIVTDEAVVAALVDGRLTPLAARERGLVKFYGDAQNAEQVSTWFERLVPPLGRQASHTRTHPESR